MISLYTTDLDLHYTWVYNPSGGFWDGRGLDASLGGLPPVEGAPELVALKRRVLETQQPERQRIATSAGDSERVYDVTVMPISASGGGPAGLTVSTLDVTDLVAAEKAAREARDYSENLLAIAGVVFLVLDRDARVRTINRRGCELLGCAESEAIGKDWIESFVPRRHRAELREVFQAVVAGHPQFSDYHENPVVDSRGRERIVAWHSRVLTDTEGRFVGVLSTGEDITERLQTLEALTESEIRFRGTFENAAVGIAHVSLDGNWLRVNERLCEILGYSREELLRLRFRDVSRQENMESDRLEARQFLVDDIAGHPHETRYVRKDGASVWARVTGSLARQADGTPAYVIAIVDDISATKEMEQSLAESEERYRLVADYTYDWEYWVGPDGVLQYVSPSCERITGHPVEAFLASPELLQSITHPEDRPAVRRHITAETSQIGPQRLEFRILMPDQQIRWVEHVCQPVYRPDGSFAGRRASIRDITRRKTAEEVLQRREAEFTALAENSPDIIARFDPSLRHLYVNAAVERATGRAPREFLGKTSDELGMPPELCMRWSRTLGEVFRTGEPGSLDFSFPTPSGERHYSLRAVPELASDGSVATVLSTTRDETERRQAEAQIGLLAAVVETSGDFIGIADLDGQALYLNPAGRVLVGLGDDTAVQDTRVEDYLFPEDLPFVRDTALPAVMRDGRWAGDLRFRHFQTGEPIAVRWEVVRIDDPATGQPIRLATVTRDMRKEKAVEEALREADRRKDEFLAILGHELRNPMAPIRSAVEIIQRLSPREPRIQWALEVLDRQTTHMKHLLDDLLDVSRIVRGKLKLHKGPVKLAEVVRQAVSDVSSLMEERRHRFTVVPPSHEVVVDGDPVRLSQVLLNLLTNAAKYTDEGGEIRLSTDETASEVVLRVKDNGRGIVPDVMRGMFDPFAQGEHRPAGEHVGLGLGLTVARRLIEAHGGRIDVTSEGPGKGAEFDVRLPRMATPRPKSSEASGSSEAGAPSLRILIVDDSADLADAVALLLRLMGHEVKVALSGVDALRVARDFRPRVALLDIAMPDMDGLELARRLRQEYPRADQLRIIAISGYGHDEAVARSVAAGFDDHLVKPVNGQVLKTLLARLQ